MTGEPHESPPGHTCGPAAGISVAVFACVALPLIVFNYDHGRAYYDQLNYHAPAIRHFLAGGDFRDYPSATTPGFHLVMAAVARWISDSERVLKFVSFLITSASIWVLTQRVARQARGGIQAVTLVLPLLFSIYFLPAGVWLLPDNLAWLSVLWVLILALDFRDDGRWYVLTSLSLVVAVLVRQSNLWLCFVVYATAMTSAPPGRDQTFAWWPLTRTSLATVPSVCVVAYFVTLWHGTVPPSFAQKHSSVNLAAAPYLLSIFAVYSVFYLPLIWSEASRWMRGRNGIRLSCWGAITGLSTTLLTPTDWSADQGRVSGLWNLTRLLPSIEHHSLVIVALSVLGGVSGALWLSLASPRVRTVTVASVLGFVAAQSLSHFVYERYYAGLVFFLIILLADDILSRAPVPSRAAFAGPAAFAAINAVILGAGLMSG